MNRFFIFLIFFTPFFCLAEADYKNTEVEISLLQEKEGVRPGGEVELAIVFKLAKNWHIYWKNPGDSGLPPEFKWKTPSLVSLSQIKWPPPERIKYKFLVNYGYNEEVIFLTKLKVDDNFKSTIIPLELGLEWLACEEICIPQSATLKKDIFINLNPKIIKENSYAFKDGVYAVDKVVSAKVNVKAKNLIAEFFPLNSIFSKEELLYENFSIYFYPEKRNFLSASEEQVYEIKKESLTLSIKPGPAELKKDLPGELVVRHADGKVKSFKTTLKFGENQLIASDTSSNKKVSFLYICLMAFLGGIILNIMPCVFPVLAIKILGFIEEEKKENSSRLRHAFSYSLGIIISMWLLVAVLLLLRYTGEAVGWGFHLQQPIIVAFLSILFFFLGLYFIEGISFGGSLGKLESLAAKKSGLLGSFGSGFLTTIAATPCTAPFMGYALGFALVLSPFKAFLIFTFLGLGVAIPYVLLSLFPNALTFLPKSGNWLNRFKQFMSFPLFATSLWLLSVLGKQTNVSHIILVLGIMLIISFFVWYFKDKKIGNSLKVFLLVALILLSYFLITIFKNPNLEQINTHGFEWQNFEPGLPEKMAEQGKIVFVDYTASWCITCKVNKKVIFSSKEFRDYLRKNDVKLLRADWTNRDPEITNSLEKLGRSSVPLNVIYKPNNDPILLPSILTPGIVLREFRK